MTKTGKKLPQFRSLALIAVGSNQNFDQIDAASVVKMALQSLVDKSSVIRSKSGFFRTPAFPPGSGPDFVNAAFSLATNLDAYALLERLHQVEADFGRERRQRWGPRTLDLDLIAFDQQIVPDVHTFNLWSNLPLEQQMAETPKQLILPHPRLRDRGFVLVPLAEVAPEWLHPVYGMTLRQMRDTLPESQLNEVQRL